jgi:aspartyl/asparaginyl beta-hydroxylase (cupin superfamily)
MSAFRDAAAFAFVPRLEARFEELVAEVRDLPLSDFAESPDSLTAVGGGYDETGWRWLGLFGPGEGLESNRRRAPRAARACEEVPGLVNAGLSLLRPGTHLYPHRGELAGVLRCHLPLLVPPGDVALRLGGETRRWQTGRCTVFDDRVEHEAWNHGTGDRVLLLVTFREQGD